MAETQTLSWAEADEGGGKRLILIGLTHKNQRFWVVFLIFSDAQYCFLWLNYGLSLDKKPIYCIFP
jgi:hypothetical protein